MGKIDIEEVKQKQNKFLQHASILIWKCMLQRRRRFVLLLVETSFAFLLLLCAIFTAKPVFLTPIQSEPKPPLRTAEILNTLRKETIVGYAPNNINYITDIMNRASKLLRIVPENIWSALDQDKLNEMLLTESKGVPLKRPITWIIWKPRVGNTWALSIRSTERARFLSHSQDGESYNPHLQAGFLAVQLAISQAIIEHAAQTKPNYEITLVAMPVSPLMEEQKVKRTLSGILLFFTLALLPPVLETEALVVNESISTFKRALRLRNVDYTSMYVSWLIYGYLTCLPIWGLASITLILIFRWIYVLEALMIVMAYTSVMIMIALLMGMFQSKVSIACVWTTLFTLLQTYLSDLLVHHRYDRKHVALTFFQNIVFPPMGLVHAFNKFALLRTGTEEVQASTSSLIYMVASWTLINLFYFALLMMLQRTIGQKRAIGGQVSWKSVLFREAKDPDKLHEVRVPRQSEQGKLQEVDELVAKAISFRDVSKSIMDIPVLHNVTFDIYRREFSMLFAERVQYTMTNTLEDLITGLATPDFGSVTVLGKKLVPGTEVLTTPQMMGYCHRSDALIEDLTVREHFTLYSQICLWNYENLRVVEYSTIRTKQLLQECNLEQVKHELVRNLNIYFRAQLCWAIALLLEPRIVVIPCYTDCHEYINVIKDKIMQYRRHMAIVSFIYTIMELEYADRIFVFDNKQLVFGGTPAYMFFKFGREYWAHITLKSSKTSEEQLRELFARAERAGAEVRAHLGSLLILKIPTDPSAHVAELVKDYTENANRYGIKSFAINVPDTYEVCKRAIAASKIINNEPVNLKSKEALKLFTENVKWKRRTCVSNTHFCIIFWKFCMFHKSHKKLFLLTFVLAVLTGVLIGFSLSTMMLNIDPTSNIAGGDERLSVEYLNIKTTLVLRVDNSSTSRSVASGYVFSDTNATKEQIKHIQYTALAHKESLTEYLAMHAIDSPQLYVFMYAYGMDLLTERNGKIVVQALYSPLHHDHSAAARSIARVYMALIRHYTGKMDATIQISDDPLMLDLSQWMKGLSTPGLTIQFMLILTITHITLLPSEEHGLIRHVQKHACNFSPFRYWITLYICDLMLYWLLASIISFVLILIVVLTVPETQLELIDLVIVPILLSLYGVGSVPQAYIFSLGPKVALNAMVFVIVNLLSGETTLIAKIFYGDVYSYMMNFMTLSPQFNMAYGFWKIEQLFMYNNECYIFQAKNLCSENTFHKCCGKCGVLQECFSRISYFNKETGLAVEIASMFAIAIFFMVLLLLIEYRIFLQLWYYATSSMTVTKMPLLTTLSPGCDMEKTNVLEKRLTLYRGSNNEYHPFGEYLLAKGVTKRRDNVYKIHNVYLGVGKDETLAMLGFKKHGMSLLCELLAGYKMPHLGNLWTMSKYNLRSQPHKYSQQVSICCVKNTLPPWLRVREALTLIATLRGLPRTATGKEVNKHIDALELDPNLYVSDLTMTQLTRLHFAAAVIAAPPVIVLDNITAFQEPDMRRTMFFILKTLRKRGHVICICSSSIENHLPLATRVAILIDGTFCDVDTCDNLVKRYSEEGFTVVVHLKDDVDVSLMFAKYFRWFEINDTTDVLANVQVKDETLTWADVFERMETLKAENHQVYSYIVTGIPMDYIFTSLINKGTGAHKTKGLFLCPWLKKLMSTKPEIMPDPQIVEKLVPLEHKYKITKLYELPWSVIFQR